MAFLHEARKGDEAGITCNENGLGISVTQRFKFAQPAGENCGDLVQR